MLLTNAIRLKIINAALDKSDLPAMRKKVEKGIKALAKLVHRTVVSIPSEVWSLPAEVRTAWVRSEVKIQIYAPGYDRYTHWSPLKDLTDTERGRLNAVLTLDDPVIVPILFGVVDVRKVPVLADAAAALIADHIAANDYEDDLRSKLRGITATANTDAQLLAIWPEGKAFIPKEVPKSRAIVDTKTLADVNKTLGLTK